MNYIEEFCDGIAIINSGSIVLKGDIHEIKHNYARDRLVVRSEQAEEIRAHLGDCCSETENGELLIQMPSAAEKQEMMKSLTGTYDIDEIKVFEPSLNDIFVEFAQDSTGGEADGAV